jgi:hypothetical protein
MFGMAGLDSLSALSSEGASMVQVVNGPPLPSALKLLLYPAVPHKNVPRNDEEDEALQDEFNGIGQVEPGSPGYNWYLQMMIDYKDGQDDKMTLLLGLATTVDILSSVLTNFCLLPVDKSTNYPALTSGQEEDGFPTGGNPSTPVTLSLSSTSQRHNDEEEYKMPTAMWGTLRVCTSENVKDCINALV